MQALQSPILRSSSDGVLVLADRQQPLAVGDEPAIAGRIGGNEAEDRRVHAGIEPIGAPNLKIGR